MIGNRYNIETELRRGAFGVIYKGFYEKRQKHVAIKVDYSPRSSLKHEIRMIQYLSMARVKNIPNIYWYGLHEDKPCVVMTLYECSLYDYYKRGLPTQANLSKIMWLLLSILEGIHKNWIVHRDIKPHNFMIKHGEFYLIDFGLATFYMNDRGEHCPNNGTDTMIGSPYFASINTHKGHRYSRRDDLISLGYVFLFMTGFSWDTNLHNIHLLLPFKTPDPFIEGEGMELINDESLTDCISTTFAIRNGVKDVIEESYNSPLDLSYPMNRYIQYQKEQLHYEYVTEDNDDSFQHYMNYVYRLNYDENPKYEPMKQLFI